MPPVRLVAPIIAVASCALFMGCQPAPHVVIAELPGEDLLDGAAPTPSPAPTPDRIEPVGQAPAAWTPKVPVRPWRWIVIHHSATAAGSAAVFDRSHRARGWDELGYHFVINNGHGGADGLVEVGSRWTKQKWGAHCKTSDNRYNDYGIGICLVGDFQNSQPTAAQLVSLRKLVIHLSDTYEIIPANVIGHGAAESTNTVCPGASLTRHLKEVLLPHLANRAQFAKR